MKKGTRKWLLIAAAIGAAFAAVLIYLAYRAPPVPSGTSSHSAESADSSAAVVPAAPPPPEPSDSDAAWMLVDPDTIDNLPRLEQDVADRALVRVSEALRRGAIAGRIVLTVPQLGQDYEGVVEEVDVDPWGNVSYVGLLRDVDDRDYRFLITAGAINTFAHIGTSRGSYEMVAIEGELGWLMPTANMDRHVDYSRPDYYVPGEKGQRANELLPR